MDVDNVGLADPIMAAHPDGHLQFELSVRGTLLERRASFHDCLLLLSEDCIAIATIASELVRALKAGGKVLVAGNGGSAAEAQHFAAELVGRFKHESRPYAALALTVDTSILTAIGNDYGFADVFARQVQAFGQPVVGGALGAVLGGPVLGLVALVAVPFGAKLLLGFKAGRRQAAFADQLDDSLQLMAGSLRAGHSLLRSVDSVSQEADAPMSEEFARIVNETRVGRDLNDSLDEVAARMGSDDFTWVAQAIAIHREVGGNLAEVLDAVGHTIRERNQIRRQVKALSAEGKLSAIVLMTLPFGVTGFLLMTNPGYLAKFTESLAGYAMLGVAGLMLLVGGLWLRKTVRITF